MQKLTLAVLALPVMLAAPLAQAQLSSSAPIDFEVSTLRARSYSLPQIISEDGREFLMSELLDFAAGTNDMTLEQADQAIWLLLASLPTAITEESSEFKALKQLQSVQALKFPISIYFLASYHHVDDVVLPDAVNPIGEKILSRARVIQRTGEYLKDYRLFDSVTGAGTDAEARQLATAQLLTDRALVMPIPELVNSGKFGAADWKGSLNVTHGGERQFEGSSISGLNHGGKKDYSGSDGISKLNVNLTNVPVENGMTLSARVDLELKGGHHCKNRSLGRSKCKDRGASASYTISGVYTLERCNDLSKCNPFVLVKESSAGVKRGSEAVSLNGRPFNASTMVFRYDGPQKLALSIGRSIGHDGKSGGPSDSHRLNVTVLDGRKEVKLAASIEDFLKAVGRNAVYALDTQDFGLAWERQFRKEVQDNTGDLYLMGSLHVLNEISKSDTNSQAQLQVIRVLRDHMIRRGVELVTPVAEAALAKQEEILAQFPTGLIILFKQKIARAMSTATPEVLMQLLAEASQLGQSQARSIEGVPASYHIIQQVNSIAAQIEALSTSSSFDSMYLTHVLTQLDIAGKKVIQ